MKGEEKEMWDSIEKLSELRAGYSCFDEEEEPFYHALSLGIKGIKALNQTNILDEIKTEIEHAYEDLDKYDCGALPESFERVLAIIDKYREEQTNE